MPMAMTKTKLEPHTGLSDEQNENVAAIFSKLLADEHVLYMQLRKYHWNVRGFHFFQLHDAFEEQYEIIKAEIDEIAERIRQHGHMAMGTLEEIKANTRLQEDVGEYPEANDMVRNLVETHEMIMRFLRADIKIVSEEIEDVSAEDYLTGLLQTHQEMAWMLRSYLE